MLQFWNFYTKIVYICEEFWNSLIFEIRKFYLHFWQKRVFYVFEKFYDIIRPKSKQLGIFRIVSSLAITMWNTDVKQVTCPNKILP